MQSTLRDIHAQRLLILDFGSQYTQLIARRVRECGVYCEIYPFDITDAEIAEFSPAGVILSGGPETVTEGATPRIPAGVFELGVPVLGICYGLQAMAAQLGGEVVASNLREFGHAQIGAERPSLLLDSMFSESDQVSVWMSHGDKVAALPEGFVCTASSANAPFAAIEDPARRFFGVQFHPEVTHTDNGEALINRFIRDICGCQGDWTSANIVDDAIAAIRAQVGSDKVVLGLSGGVDSSVVAALLAKAIGSQLTCIFVDNGLLRKNESEEVRAAFSGAMGEGTLAELNIKTIDAQSEFLDKLAGRRRS
jgi:GMP synthase (glutamine-hydrolysing)